MAYRRSNGKGRKRSKLQPAVRTLTFIAPGGISYIDLSLAASIANRRSYSQNVNWAVSGFTILSGSATGAALSVFKLPETWVMENALVKSNAMWSKMNEQVLDNEPSIQGRYHDFKVYFDSVMASANALGVGIQCQLQAGGTILTPLSEDAATGTLHTTNSLTTTDFKDVAPVSPRGDWDYSKIQIPNVAVPGATVEFTIHAVGADSGQSKSCIEGYGLSRSRPHEIDPNNPTVGGWMTELFDLGDNQEEIREDLEGDNDRPPYAVRGTTSSSEAYPGGSTEFDGGQLHEIVVLSGTQIGGKTRMSGGVFQCGLMKLNNSGDPVMIQVHLAPGPHRGYMTEKVGA